MNASPFKSWARSLRVIFRFRSKTPAAGVGHAAPGNRPTARPSAGPRRAARPRSTAAAERSPGALVRNSARTCVQIGLLGASYARLLQDNRSNTSMYGLGWLLIKCVAHVRQRRVLALQTAELFHHVLPLHVSDKLERLVRVLCAPGDGQHVERCQHRQPRRPGTNRAARCRKRCHAPRAPCLAALQRRERTRQRRTRRIGLRSADAATTTITTVDPATAPAPAAAVTHDTTIAPGPARLFSAPAVPVIHLRPVAPDDVRHPRALLHHRHVAVDERILRRVKPAQPGAELPHPVAPQPGTVCADPGVGRAVGGCVDRPGLPLRVVDRSVEPQPRELVVPPRLHRQVPGHP